MTDFQFVKPGIDQALSHIVEECGEVLAAAGKTQRHGFDSVNPLLSKEDQETNIDWLLRELQDLTDAIERFRKEVYVKYFQFSE